MIFDVLFFILTPYSFPTQPVKHMMFQLCCNYTDLLRIEHSLIWYDFCKHRIGISGDITV